jgi:hypothetical protein
MENGNFNCRYRKKIIVVDQIKNECLEPTDSLTVELPCLMIERIEKYAKKNDSNVSGVLLEALDTFLRNHK